MLSVMADWGILNNSPAEKKWKKLRNIHLKPWKTNKAVKNRMFTQYLRIVSFKGSVDFRWSDWVPEKLKGAFENVITQKEKSRSNCQKGGTYIYISVRDLEASRSKDAVTTGLPCTGWSSALYSWCPNRGVIRQREFIAIAKMLKRIKHGNGDFRLILKDRKIK